MEYLGHTLSRILNLLLLKYARPRHTSRAQVCDRILGGAVLTRTLLFWHTQSARAVRAAQYRLNLTL